MKKLLFFFVLLTFLGSNQALGQAANNGISYTTAFNSPALASYPTIPTLPAPLNRIAGGSQDVVVGPIAMPFIFFYGGVQVSQYWISSNGWITFDAGTAADPNKNNIEMNGSGRAMIAPMWDEKLRVAPTASGGVVRTQNNATVLYIDWSRMLWDSTASNSYSSFRVILYSNGTATPNRIEFQDSVSVNGNIVGSPNASRGLVGWCSGDFYSVNSGFTGASKLTLTSNLNLGGGPRRLIWNPVNNSSNLCGGAQPLTMTKNAPTFYRGATLQTDSTVGTPTGCAPSGLLGDMWFTFTKPAGITNFEIKARNICFGSGSRIEAYTGTCAALTPVGCATDSLGIGTWGYLELTNQPCASTVYYVRVEADDATDTYFDFVVQPPGVTCVNANNIAPCGLPYTYTTFASNGAFEDNFDSTSVACNNRANTGPDYFFEYTPPSDVCINVTASNITPGSFPALFIYRGCPGSGTCNAIAQITPGNVTSVTANNITLSAGVQYFIVIENDTVSSGGVLLDNFDINITGAAVGVLTGDNCASPIALTVSTPVAPCTDPTYNLACYRPSIPEPSNPGCGAFVPSGSGDIWFSFTAAATQVHQLSITRGLAAPIATDVAAAVYSGTCGALVLLGCDDNSNGFGMPTLPFAATTGQTYYIRVWSANGAIPGNFRICVDRGCSPPNDACGSAVPLVYGVAAVNQTNVCASNVTEPNTGSCMSASFNTVWYSFVATTTSIRIRTRLRTLTNSTLALYPNCTVGTAALACNDDAPPCGGFGAPRNSELFYAGLSIGNTYYVSVDGTASNTGTFDIVAIDGASTVFPPTPDQDCQLPTTLCSGNVPLAVADPGFQGYGNNCDLNTGTCLASAERGGSWYTFTTVTGAGGGNLSFTIAPNDGTTDYDFQIWEITGISNYCNLILTNPTSATFPFRSCNYSALGTTGLATPAPSGAFNPALALGANTTRTFILLVSNFTNSTSGFNLSFGATPLAGVPPVAYWQNATTNTWGTLTNWSPNACMSQAPTCANGISAVITNTGPAINYPIIPAGPPIIVKDITINAGASLTVAAGATLLVCGDFINNGSLICGAGSTITLTGTAASQLVQGNLTGANAFANFTVAKTSGTANIASNIDVTGNLTITGGVFSAAGRTVTLGGNFSNALGAPGHLAGVNYIFNGTAAQSWSNQVSQITLANVTMNKTAGTLLNIVDNGAVISDFLLGSINTLTLTNGIIVTGPRLVDIPNTVQAAVSIGNAGSYIRGFLRRAIPNNFGATAPGIGYNFPLGDATKGYQRIQLQYTVIPTAAYTITGQFRPWAALPPANGPAATECALADWSSNEMLDNGYWTLEAGSGTSLTQGTYNADAYPLGQTNQVAAGSWGAGSTGSQFTVVKSPSNNGAGPFAIQGTCFGGGLAPVERNGLSGFSDFAIGQFGSTLPIELLNFTAEKEKAGVLCSWTTKTEINNEYFDVEKSIDGLEFIKIGRVAGSGTTAITKYYNFLDADPCSGTQYYRLKQVDYDGNFTYSDIIAIDCRIDKFEVNVYPNPTNLELNYVFYEEREGKVNVELVDMLGNIVAKENRDVKKGYNSFKTSVQSIAAGAYYLKIVNASDNSIKQVKFFKN